MTGINMTHPFLKPSKKETLPGKNLGGFTVAPKLQARWSASLHLACSLGLQTALCQDKCSARMIGREMIHPDTTHINSTAATIETS
jgi:hypothetical protein